MVEPGAKSLDAFGGRLEVANVDEPVHEGEFVFDEPGVYGRAYMGSPNRVFERGKRALKPCERAGIGCGHALLLCSASRLKVDNCSHSSKVHPGSDKGARFRMGSESPAKD